MSKTVRTQVKVILLELAIIGYILLWSSVRQALAVETPDLLPFKVMDGVVEVGCTWDNGCNDGYHGTSGLGPSIDFIAPVGTNVYAAGSGVVVAANNTCHPTESPGCSGSRGRFVEIQHPDGRHSRYLHLSEAIVTSGSISKGQLVGKVGNSGGSPVPHLHYDETIDGSKVDPGTMIATHSNQTVYYPSHFGYGSWDEVPAWSDRFVYSDTGSESSFPNFSIDSGGYWHGSPPDGIVVQNSDGGGHRYVAAGGRLFYYNRGDVNLDSEFRRQMQQRLGSDQPAWMHNDDVHAIEVNYPSSAAHRPVDNSLLREYGSLTQYVMQYSYAWPLASVDELSF